MARTASRSPDFSAAMIAVSQGGRMGEIGGERVCCRRGSGTCSCGACVGRPASSAGGAAEGRLGAEAVAAEEEAKDPWHGEALRSGEGPGGGVERTLGDGERWRRIESGGRGTSRTS